jgi:hypothetical protein
MKKYLFSICMIVWVVIGCTSRTKQQMNSLQNDSILSVRVDSLSSETTDSLSAYNNYEAIAHRVTAMFNDVYRHYAIEDSIINNGKTVTTHIDKTIYYSASLKALWDKLPEDDIVIDYDPWTMSQDYDTLVCRNVAVRSVTNKTAIVDVEIFLSRNWPEKTIRLQLVYEKNKTANKDDWFIADFQYNGSLAKEISDYLKEYNQD